jgi:LPS export ABC transporter protein LptC
MRNTSIRYYVLAVALLMGCFCVFSSCENDEEEVDAFFKKKAAVEEAKNVESFLSQSGKVKARLTSPYMLRVQGGQAGQVDSPYMEFPRTMHVDFYDDSTVIESTLDAKYAKYVEFDRKVLLRDSVLVQSIKNGDTLRTQELWWDQDKQEFYTDKPAHVYQRDKIIFAKNGLRAAQNLTAYTFYSSSGPMLVPNSGVPQ